MKNLREIKTHLVRIGIDCTPLENINGGIAFYLQSLISELIKKNPDIHFIFYTFKPCIFQEHLSKNGNIEIISIPKMSFFHALWTQTSLALHLWKDCPDYFWSPTQLTPLFKRKNLKTLITIHDFVFMLYPKTMSPYRGFLMRFLSRHLFKSADIVLCNSQGTKNKLYKFYGVGCSEVVVPPVKSSISTKSHVESLPFLKQHGLNYKNFILTTGSIEPRKNYVLLIEFYLSLFKKNDPNDILPLVLIGGGGWRNVEIHKKITEAKKLYPTHFFHLGFVSDTELSYAYSSAKYYIMFSLYEGYGMPLAEARTCGTPVICFDQEEMKEAAEYDGLFLDPNDYHEQLEKCFKKSNPDLLSVKKCSYPSAAEQADKIARFLK